MSDNLADRIAGMTEAELVTRNSASMKRLEAIWDEVAQRMDVQAGDDRCGPMAQGMAEAERIRAQLTDLHRRMDQFAAVHGNVPIARSGER